MKLRTLIFVALVAVSVLPVGMLAYWQHKTANDNEFSVVENQHKVIAKNLTIALERYATDLRSAFQLDGRESASRHKVDGLEQHLSELYFKHVCSIDADGNIQRLQCALACPQNSRFPQSVLASLRDTLNAATANPGRIYFSPITLNPAGHPAIYLVRKMADGNIAIGEVAPDYFIELQQAVAFGEKGHAAIVDQTGRVIAHPRQTWMASIKDLSGVSVVQQMMNGENGVTRFYSPAVEADMVAGFQCRGGAWLGCHGAAAAGGDFSACEEYLKGGANHRDTGAVRGDFSRLVDFRDYFATNAIAGRCGAGCRAWRSVGESGP